MMIAIKQDNKKTRKYPTEEISLRDLYFHYKNESLELFSMIDT